MILHCTLPYRQDIPNPALGYLKGFLQAEGIPVRNVYWNLILARVVIDFHKMLEKYVEDAGLSSISAITLYLCKQLLIQNQRTPETTLDLLFSSIFPKTEILKAVNTFKNEIDQTIAQENLHKDSLAGFTLKTYQWPMGYYIIQRLKQLNPDMKIVIGGIATEPQGLSFMNIFTSVDYAIWGEGEYPLLQLVRALEENDSLETVPNLVYRVDSTIRSTESIKEHRRLDEYPFADHTDYFAIHNRFLPPQMPTLIPIWGSRSCPWNRCKFCVLNEEYPYQARSPESIIEEIEYQLERHNIDNFIFVDTELPGNMRRFKTLLKLLVESSANRKRPYHLFAEVSPVFIDAETAHLMSLASFSSIQIGFEAVTDTLLEKMQKRHRFAHNIQALKLGNQYDLSIDGLNIIRDTPTETAEDIVESSANLKYVRFLLNKYPLSPIFLMLFKGSPYYSEVPEKDRESWKSDTFWEEIAPTTLVPDSDRFEIFGFSKGSPTYYNLWDSFQKTMESYKRQNRTYRWMEYPDGSFVEEKGPKIYKYTFDRDETDVLVFCDTLRSFPEVREKFSHIPEEPLLEMLAVFKEVGLLYYDKDMQTIISVLEAATREPVKSPVS